MTPIDFPFKDISLPTKGTPSVDINKPGLKFADILTATIPYILGAAGIILLLILVASGFQLMTSAGDPKKIEAAKGKLTNAFVGIIIIFASFWIVQILGRFLGIEIFKELFSK